MKNLKYTILLATLMVGLSSCNTVEGIGQDMKKGGEVVRDAAN